MGIEGKRVKQRKEDVRRSYSTAASKATQGGKTCCQSTSTPVPSFGCITSLARLADLKLGDIVVDFGSGLGHDVFEASEQVGPSGRVIGVDFTPEMVSRARKVLEERGYTNIDFKLADMEDVPLPDEYADVAISNCVINLSPSKERVFNEAYRILKPGGRLVDADEIAGEELPQSLVTSETMWCRCVGGALTEKRYLELVEKAGFTDVKVVIKGTHKFLWGDKEITIHSGILSATKPSSLRA